MFVGDAPTKADEREGRPFMDEAGYQVLREAVKKLGLEHDAYYTNGTACRGCAQHYDSEGQPSVGRDGSPFIIDQTPSPVQLAACRPRLEEEIYLVDPLIVVALGGAVAGHLLKRSVSVLAENGTTHSLSIPGAGVVPKLTEKKKRWVRVVKGQVSTPVQQNMVDYICVVCLHPNYVLSNITDKRPGNPTEAFMNSLKLVRDVYRRLEAELPGITNAR